MSRLSIEETILTTYMYNDILSEEIRNFNPWTIKSRVNNKVSDNIYCTLGWVTFSILSIFLMLLNHL